MTTVTLYTRPGCQPCKMVRKLLDRKNIEHVCIDVTTDDAAYAYVQQLGYTGVPVMTVTTDDELIDHWYGYRTDKIAELKNAVAA